MNHYIVGLIISVAGTILGGGIVLGKLFQRVKTHDEAIAECHVEDLVTRTDCGNTSDRIVDQIREIRNEMREDLNDERQRLSGFMTKTSNTLGRIEGSLERLNGFTPRGGT